MLFISGDFQFTNFQQSSHQNMDPMSQVEEDSRLREEQLLKDLKEAMMIDEVSFFKTRDLNNKGKDVLPSGKHKKEVSSLAEVIKTSKRKSSTSDTLPDYNDENLIRDFDLNSSPRILIYSGLINKKERGYYSLLYRYLT